RTRPRSVVETEPRRRLRVLARLVDAIPAIVQRRITQRISSMMKTGVIDRCIGEVPEVPRALPVKRRAAKTVWEGPNCEVLRLAQGRRGACRMRPPKNRLTRWYVVLVDDNRVRNRGAVPTPRNGDAIELPAFSLSALVCHAMTSGNDVPSSDESS